MGAAVSVRMRAQSLFVPAVLLSFLVLPSGCGKKEETSEKSAKASDDDDKPKKKKKKSDDEESDEKKDDKKKDDGFKVSAELPENCKENVEWLKACAKRISDDDLMGRAKTMQEAYLKIVDEKGKSGADTQCKNLQGIVKSNAKCKE